jgi:hypothetical protein
MSTDGPILVAPRPVRLAITPYSPVSPNGRALRGKRLASAPVDLLERMQINEEAPAERTGTEWSTSASPLRESAREGSVTPLRSSPSLAAEAWEDFLSVLKPAMDQPLGSAGLFAPFRGAPSFAIERSYRISPRLLSDMSHEQRSPRTPPPDHQMVGLLPLGSPVSRKQTRNPFQRHPSYEVPQLKSPIRWSPVARPSAPARFAIEPLSPTSVPLPSPTASETTD